MNSAGGTAPSAGWSQRTGQGPDRGVEQRHRRKPRRLTLRGAAHRGSVPRSQPTFRALRRAAVRYRSRVLKPENAFLIFCQMPDFPGLQDMESAGSVYRRISCPNCFNQEDLEMRTDFDFTP